MINIKTKDFLIEAVLESNSKILEKIKWHHASIGNDIFTKGWNAYNSMNNPHIGFNRTIHVHAQHGFGIGVESTFDI